MAGEHGAARAGNGAPTATSLDQTTPCGGAACCGRTATGGAGTMNCRLFMTVPANPEWVPLAGGAFRGTLRRLF